MVPVTVSAPPLPSLTSTLTISDAFYNINDINVQLDITHPRVSDLSAFLIAPDATMIELFSNVGGTGINFRNTVFDDSATLPISSGSAPFTGTFRPAQPLTPLIGKVRSEGLGQAVGSVMAALGPSITRLIERTCGLWLSAVLIMRSKVGSTSAPSVGEVMVTVGAVRSG